MATGCTVVVKPSEYATLTTIRLTQLIEEAGVPARRVQPGARAGRPTGEALITHPGVDKVTFTGSRAVGKRILAASGDTIKRVTLELGGKSPSIVFEDAPSVSGRRHDGHGHGVDGHLRSGLCLPDPFAGPTQRLRRVHQCRGLADRTW